MILSAISNIPAHWPAIRTAFDEISYGELFEKVEQVRLWLISHQTKVLLLESDNVPEWIYIDLACQQAGVIFVPVPSFFSKSQIDYMIAKVKPDLYIRPSQCSSDWSAFVLPCFQYQQIEQTAHEPVPNGTSKITFTSGSTGSPKGVCLSIENQYLVAKSLVERIGIERPNHFCLLSFSTLLENVAGVYAPLMAGGTIYVLTSEQRGFNGAVITSSSKLLSAISASSPTSIILVPELLQFFLHAAMAGWQAPSTFEFIAVGGSKVSPQLIQQAQQIGLPVYQGYGLSECASVVALSDKAHTDLQSTGQILPHLTVNIEHGEVVVTGNSFLGYFGAPDTWYQTQVNTGDLGQLSNGQLTISGRASNLIINSFGRNISPEWIESELMSTGAFSQVVVFGDARPYLVALVLPREPDTLYHTINDAIERVNKSTPEYAHIKSIHVLSESLSFEQQQLTSNGRPKRQKIYQDYSQEINELYQIANIEVSLNELI